MWWVSLILALFLLSCSTPSLKIENSVNPYHSTLSGGKCEIWTDPDGIAHVRASSEKNAWGCLGFLHGRDRAFHMDLLRRIVQGRSAEILGSARVKDDFFFKLLGLYEQADRVFPELPKEIQEILWAYSYGANTGLDEAIEEGVYELEELDYQPEPWRPQDSLGILLLQSFAETKVTFTNDVTEDAWKKTWGERAAALMTPEGLPWDIPILKPGEFKPLSGNEKTLTDDAPRGSNNWALSSAWTQSGKAWFANDPHVGLQYPSFWYWAHVQGGELDAIGSTVPGMPLLASGLNRHMAWGLTDSFLNVADVIAVPEGETSEFISTRPTIWIQVGPLRVPFFFKTYQRSRDGYPILPLDAPDGKVLVLRWSGFHLKGKHLSVFPQLPKAKTVEQMDKLMAQLQLPSFNYVFSDTEGGIGYRAIGLIPRETTPTPFAIREGTMAEVRRYSFLSADEAPHLVNPGRGYIVTANNRVFPAGQRHSGRAFANGFRALRIEEMLKTTHAHDLESQRRIICDNQIVDARFLAPRLLAYVKSVPLREENIREALRIVSEWNFNGETSCRACGVYQRWVERLRELWIVNLPGLYRLLAEQPEPKLQLEVIQELRQTLVDIKGDGEEEFPIWGDLHRAYFDHVSQSSLFSSDDWIPTPGNSSSVNAGGAKWKNNYYVHHTGASHRILVEMTSPPKAYLSWEGIGPDKESRSLNRSGSSWQRWSRCEFQPLRFPLDWDSVPKTVIPLSQ